MTTSSRDRAPRRVTQAQRRAVTRAKITSAGLEAMAERGYTAMTFADVADRAGVSRGALLHYFPQKPDLALATIEDGATLLLRDLRAHVDATRDGEDRDEQVFEGIFAVFAGSLYQAFLALQVHARTDPELNERLKRIANQAVGAYGDIALEVWGEGLADHPDWPAFIWLVNDVVRGITLSVARDRVEARENEVWLMARGMLLARLAQMRRDV